MSRRIFEKIIGVFEDVAKRKHRAAQARNQKMTVDERSGDVYRESCARIADAFASDGFSYAKSGPHMSKRSGSFKHLIVFQTGFHNVHDEHVALRVAANVRSPVLKKWRAEQSNPCRTDDWVAGGLVHRLSGENTYVEWDLANRTSRSRTTADVIAYLRAVVLPYFARFSDPAAVVKALRTTEIPAFDLNDSVEFALCFGGREDAKRIIERYLRRHPELFDEAETVYRRYSQNGFPPRMVSKYTDQLAWLWAAYDLKE